MTTANNFVSLNLSYLEKSILNDSCILKLYSKNFNIRVVRLETKDGKIHSVVNGFSFINCLQKLNEDYQKGDFPDKPPFVPTIIDSNLDFRIIHHSEKLTITKKTASSCLSGVLKDYRDKILLKEDSPHLTELLSKIDTSALLS